MKKNLTLAIAFIAVFSLVSCNDCQECDDNKEKEKENVPVFQVGPEALTFDTKAGEPQYIYVLSSSDVSWKAEVEAAAQDWLTITTETNKVTVSAGENTTNNERRGKIIIEPDNDTFDPVEVGIVQYSFEIINITATKATLDFWGDHYECGSGFYDFIMGSGDAEYDDYYEYIIVNNGYLMIFNILGDDITHREFQVTALNDGTYTSSPYPADEDPVFEKMSFFKTGILYSQKITSYNGSMVLKYENGEVVERFILSDGQIDVKYDNGNYIIVADLPISDREKIVIDYSGNFDATFNLWSYSTYKSDVELSDLDSGVIEFYGEIDYFDGLYNWIITIDTPEYHNIYVSNLLISLFSPMTSMTVLDSGTYVISGDPPYPTFTAEAGNAFFGNLFGTWIVGYTDIVITDGAPLIEGTVIVTHNGRDNYTIKVDALMDNYYTVKATFEGDLEYVDITGSVPQPMPPHKIHSAKVLHAPMFKERLISDRINRYN